MSYSILILNDLHAGSVFGMLPPDFQTSDSGTRGQNSGQKYLWDCWTNLAGIVSQAKLDAIVINGDAIDGPQVKSRGQECALTDLNDQQRAAIKTLKVMTNAINAGPSGKIPLYFVQGTEYHDGRGAENFENIAQEMGGEIYSGLGTGRYSHEVLDLEFEGVELNVAHHVGGGGGITRGNALDKEMIMSALAGKMGKFPRTDCLIRAHMHFFCHVEHASKHGVIAPCWQLQTRFMRHRSVYQMVPDIGAIVVHIDPEAKKRGLDPIRIQKFLYQLPSLVAHKFKKKS
jgi:hypothetical protein